MNKDQIKKSLGHHVRIRPLVKRFEGPKELLSEDDDWIISRVDTDHVELSNIRTGHIAILGMDHVFSYVSEPGRNHGGIKHGFLQLRVQVSIVGGLVQIEPLPPGEWGKQPESRLQSDDQNIQSQQSQRRVMDTAVEKAQRANAEALARAQRMQLLETQGMEAAREEHAALRQSLDEKISHIQQHLTAIKLEQGCDGHAYLIRTDRVSLNFYLYRTLPVTESRIVVQEFDGALILPKDRSHRMFVIGEEPRQVSKKEFYFDYQEPAGWCWKEKRNAGNSLTTAELAEHLIARVLDLHERFQGRERVFNRRRDSGHVGPWS